MSGRLLFGNLILQIQKQYPYSISNFMLKKQYLWSKNPFQMVHPAKISIWEMTRSQMHQVK